MKKLRNKRRVPRSSRRTGGEESGGRHTQQEGRRVKDRKAREKKKQ
jgi:hypothetical protein